MSEQDLINNEYRYLLTVTPYETFEIEVFEAGGVDKNNRFVPIEGSQFMVVLGESEGHPIAYYASSKMVTLPITSALFEEGFPINDPKFPYRLNKQFLDVIREIQVV